MNSLDDIGSRGESRIEALRTQTSISSFFSDLPFGDGLGEDFGEDMADFCFDSNGEIGRVVWVAARRIKGIWIVCCVRVRKIRVLIELDQKRPSEGFSLTNS